MKKNAHHIIIILSILFLIGISLLNSRPFPFEYEIQKFQYVSQPDEITCGPTSTLMVLKMYGKNLQLKEVEEQTKTLWFTYKDKPIGMTAPDYVVRAMHHFGVPATIKHGSIADLKYYVSKNRPVICLVRSGRTTWHYVVVIGYSVDKIVIADPSGGTRSEYATEDFEGSWSFKTEMDGSSISEKCSFCGGSGRLSRINFGPSVHCDFCSGTGFDPDYVKALLRTADIYPYTMMVPSIDIVK